MNREKIINLVYKILVEIEGEVEGGGLRDGLIETPRRVADMYAELFGGYDNSNDEKLIKIFSPENGRQELVISKNIKFYSMCEHHVLPFYGSVDIAYLSKPGKLLGISKFSRIVDKFARRLNIQEQMTSDICDFIYKSELEPDAVMVIVDAVHLCEIMRGVKKDGVRMMTSSVRGTIIDNMKLRNEVLLLLNRGR